MPHNVIKKPNLNKMVSLTIWGISIIKSDLAINQSNYNIRLAYYSFL